MIKCEVPIWKCDKCESAFIEHPWCSKHGAMTPFVPADSFGHTYPADSFNGMIETLKRLAQARYIGVEDDNGNTDDTHSNGMVDGKRELARELLGFFCPGEGI